MWLIWPKKVITIIITIVIIILNRNKNNVIGSIGRHLSRKKPPGLLRSDTNRSNGIPHWFYGQQANTSPGRWPMSIGLPEQHHISMGHQWWPERRLIWPQFENRQNTMVFPYHAHLCPLLLSHWDQWNDPVLIISRRLEAVFLSNHLFQCLSIITQQFNAAIFMAYFKTSVGTMIGSSKMAFTLLFSR